MRKKPGVASQAFRQAANSVQKSDHWLGDYFRRKKAKGGNKYAVVTTANKIATIYYKMIRYKEEFKPLDLKQYQQNYKQAKIEYFERKLSELKRSRRLSCIEENFISILQNLIISLLFLHLQS